MSLLLYPLISCVLLADDEDTPVPFCQDPSKLQWDSPWIGKEYVYFCLSADLMRLFVSYRVS